MPFLLRGHDLGGVEFHIALEAETYALGTVIQLDV